MEKTVLQSEFGAVSIEVDKSSNSPRLKITNLVTNWAVFLDPLELASLTTLSHADFARFINPAQFNKPLDGFDSSSVQRDYLSVGVEDVEAFLREQQNHP